MSAPFQARYETTCLVCHGTIEPGSWVVFNDDRQVVHRNCALTEEDE